MSIIVDSVSALEKSAPRSPKRSRQLGIHGSLMLRRTSNERAQLEAVLRGIHSDIQDQIQRDGNLHNLTLDSWATTCTLGRADSIEPTDYVIATTVTLRFRPEGGSVDTIMKTLSTASGA